MVILGINDHAVQRPIRDASGGLRHVGHGVVGENTKGRNGDEVVIVIILNGLIIVKDVEFQIIAGNARSIGV